MNGTGTAPLRVAHLDSGRAWRGGQAQVLLLLKGLARRGVSNTLLAPRGPLLEHAQHDGFETRAWSPLSDLDGFALIRAVALLRRIGPDVVHCHDGRSHAVGVPAARFAGVGAVVVSRRVAVPVGVGIWSVLKYRMPVDRYLCVSRSVLETMRRAGLPEERLALVRSGVSQETPREAADLRWLAGVPAGCPVVLTVGALTPEKRHEDLLEAAVAVTAVSDAHFVWLGDGPRRKWLERRRADLGLDPRVHVLGFRSDARALVAQASVVALASELEGLSTSLMDASAAGVPVVATAVGGVPEVVADGESGRLVAARDPAALAGALIEVLTRADLREAWGAKGRERAGEFHIDRTVDHTLREYFSLLGRGEAAA